MRRLAHALLGVALAAGAARADDEVSQRLSGYETEARNLATDLPTAQQLATPTMSPNRLVDAEVAFSLGDYDGAVQTLFDFVDKPGPDAEAATFYLAESMYQKGDRGAAHTYFAQLANAVTVNSKYYQPALERLVELAIAQNDDSDVATWLGKMDQISPGLRRPSSPYVRGKYAYSKGKFDEALAYFQDVPKGSDFELQALFYTGTVAVAKKDLPRATEIFADLIDRKPRTANDRRIIEHAQLALGRLYYERDEFGRSIDAYVRVDRHSDLFPDALYEVSWVYVKNKQYDKALRALELLEQSEPQSGRTPTIRILEGNLRIRKAQMLRASQVEGTGNAADDPGVEYDKANKVFTETHDEYFPAWFSLSQIDDKADMSRYLEQIAGGTDRVFSTTAPLPEEAAILMRDEPGVQRLVAVATDLEDIKSNLAQARSTIERLEAVVAAHDKYAVYPALASRRGRIASIEDDLAKLRNDLADQQLSLINSNGDLAQLTANRKQLAQQYASMPNAEQAHADHIAQAHAGYDQIEATAGEVDSALDSAQAMAVAVRVFAATDQASSDLKAAAATGLEDTAKEARAIADELADIQKELRIGRDLAGFNDDGAQTTRDLRNKLLAAQDAEHRVLASYASSSKDPKKSQALAALADRASRVAQQLQQTDGQIDQIAEGGLAAAKATLAKDRTDLEGMQKELEEAQTEARDAGGDVLSAGIKDAKDRLYDVVIRTDVGNVDVAWSRKEDDDDDLKRLNLARSRELKQLKDEFHDILDEQTVKPVEKHKLDLPAPDASGNERVNAGTGKTNGNSQGPSVKPDASKDPKKDPKADPKKGNQK